eukprot:scaffold178_cov30-Prasinocladus_malaysianus.AAC.1
MVGHWGLSGDGAGDQTLPSLGSLIPDVHNRVFAIDTEQVWHLAPCPIRIQGQLLRSSKSAGKEMSGGELGCILKLGLDRVSLAIKGLVMP